ncbi:MAG: PIG-L family deacetylase [Fibrobacterales bacterium]
MSESIKTLYIFPHPDDESFGPAPVIHRQKSLGEEVYLLTLTRGGATTQRHTLNYTIEEMGEVRFREMLDVEKVLSLDGMTILDYADGGLKDMNPLILEKVIIEEIERIKPNIIVTYPIHGISGHYDHITGHGIIKRVFCALRKKEGYEYLKRLCFYTLGKGQLGAEHREGVRPSLEEEIDVTVHLDELDIIAFKKALGCYKTYSEVIASTKVIDKIGNRVHFEVYDEHHEPHLGLISENLPQ